MTTGPSTTQTPYLVSYDPLTSFTSLLSAGDVAGTKPDGSAWRYVGTPDGIGWFDNGDGTMTVMNNHELLAGDGVVRAHGSIGSFVDQFIVDKTTLQVSGAHDLGVNVFNWDVTSQQYVAGTTVWQRFCSSDMAAPTAFYDSASGLGTTERLYLTGEEVATGRAWGFIATGAHAGDVYELAGMGNLAFENIVANPTEQVKTIAMLDNDTSPRGQVYMYVGTKQGSGTELDKAGLTDGQLYGVAVAGLTAESTTTDLTNGAAFTMASLGDVSSLDGAALNTAANAAGVTGFLRPEDGAWDPSHPSWYYFVTTDAYGAPSRLWRLEFTDIHNPEAGGTIKEVLNGTEGQQMFDNITVTQDGKVVLLEDPGNNAELAKVWFYDPTTNSLDQLANHDPGRFTPPGTAPFIQDEESSGVIDATAALGDAHTRAFLLDTQAHYINSDKELVEGGQLQLLKIDTTNWVAGTGGDDLMSHARSDAAWHLDGGAGSDSLIGGGKGDYLNGGAGVDRINGGGGADIIDGGAGSDRVSGNAGDDIFVFSKSSIGALDPVNGYDQIVDFEGAGVAGGDVLQFNGFSSQTAPTFAYVKAVGSYQQYEVHDGAYTGEIWVHSANGNQLTAGDFLFT